MKIDAKRYMLFNEDYGYISDPDKKFLVEGRMGRKRTLIVEEDLSENSKLLSSLFKLVRMANPKELMEVLTLFF
jgi:hypothetical protein